MTTIAFYPRPLAEQLEGRPHQAIISISTPSRPPAQLQHGWAEVLRLVFADADGGEDAFTDDHAGQVLGFMARHQMQEHGFVVHCDAGLSRSAAVAMFLGSVTGYPVYIQGKLPLGPHYALYNRYVLSALNRMAYSGVYAPTSK